MLIKEYLIPPSGLVSLPAGARLMKLEWDLSHWVLWAAIDPNERFMSQIHFKCVHNDDVIDPAWHYLTSVILHDVETTHRAYHWFMVVEPVPTSAPSIIRG